MYRDSSNSRNDSHIITRISSPSQHIQDSNRNEIDQQINILKIESGIGQQKDR